MTVSRVFVSMGAAIFAAIAIAPHAAHAAEPYKVVSTNKVGGLGGWDYVYADGDGRQLYIPRSGGTGASGRVSVYDLDTLKPTGEISETNSVHGVAVDPKCGHGFVSSRPVVMFDTKTLKSIKTIEVEGNPDGIFFDSATEHVFVLSHRQPNVTVIDAKDGSIVGTIDLGGAAEQGASDGQGHVYIDVEDKDNVAVVDANTLKVTAHYDLAGKGGGPAGLALDAKNHVLFAFCHEPQTVVILNADDGKIITTLPIGRGVDGAAFNPDTMEAFSSQGDGTLTVVKENSPTEFEIAQNVQTKAGARTCTLDAKTGKIFLITAEFSPPPSQPATATTQTQGRRGGRGGRRQMVPDSFTIVVVGR